MPPRAVQPLPQKYPELAATWDAETNGEPCPPDLHPGSTRPAYWRCAAGHRWREPVARRVKLEPWKEGDRAACRVCVGGWVVTAFACGHTAAVPASKAQPHYRHCPACWEREKARREAEWEALQAARRERKTQLTPQCRAEAAAEADRLWDEMQLDRLPEVLQRVARQQLTTALTEALMAQQVGGRTRSNLAALLDELRTLVEVGVDAVATHGRGPVELLGERFWAPSLASAEMPRALREEDVVASLATVAGPAARLEDQEGEWVARDWAIEVAYEADPNTPVPTSWVTRHITEQLKGWAYAHGWRSYRELRLPLRDARAFGRLDLVIFRRGLPDIVVEIDSENVPRSVAKLELARDRGAFAVWLRWQQGGVPEFDGVHILDLREAAVI